MIRSISVKPENKQDFLKLELANPYKTGLAVGSISGLDPGQATINVVDLASSDGSYYTNSRYSSRNIVLAIVILNDWPEGLTDRKIGSTQYKNAIEYNRHILYNYFPVKRKVAVQIETDVNTMEIEGYIESNSVGIFSSSESSQVSIVCPYPYFHDISTTVNIGTFSNIVPGVEFKAGLDSSEEPKAIGWSSGSGNALTPSIGYDYPKQIFSITNLNSSAYYYYLGDIDYGFNGRISIRGTSGDVTIVSGYGSEYFKISNSIVTSITGSALGTGDVINFSTINGKKYISLTRNGSTTNILNSLETGSTWLRVYPGDNVFEILTSAESNMADFTLVTDIYYQGV